MERAVAKPYQPWAIRRWIAAVSIIAVEALLWLATDVLFAVGWRSVMVPLDIAVGVVAATAQIVLTEDYDVLVIRVMISASLMGVAAAAADWAQLAGEHTEISRSVHTLHAAAQVDDGPQRFEDAQTELFKRRRVYRHVPPVLRVSFDVALMLLGVLFGDRVQHTLTAGVTCTAVFRIADLVKPPVSGPLLVAATLTSGVIAGFTFTRRRVRLGEAWIKEQTRRSPQAAVGWLLARDKGRTVAGKLAQQLDVAVTLVTHPRSEAQEFALTGRNERRWEPSPALDITIMIFLFAVGLFLGPAYLVLQSCP